MLTFRLNILKCGDRGTNSFIYAENVSGRERKKQAAFLALKRGTGLLGDRNQRDTFH